MITDIINSVSELISSSPAAGVAIAGAVAMTASGLVAYIIKDVPMGIFRSFKSFILTELIVDDSTYLNKETFSTLAILISKSTIPLLSRSMSESSFYSSTSDTYDLVRDVSIGYGSHIFKYKGCYLYAYRSKVDSGTKPYDRLRVLKFGFNKSLLKGLLNEAKSVGGTDIVVKHLNDGWWTTGGNITGCGLSNLILEDGTKELLTDHIDRFIARKNPVITKLTFLLHGKPGGGKTGLIRALANEYKRNVYALELSGLNDATLRKAVNNVPKGSILLIEDCDCISATVSRDTKSSDKPVLTLGGVLNALDGIVPLNDVLTFLTTNNIENLDDALIRTARVDEIVELPMVSKETVMRKVKELYGKDVHVTEDLKGSDVYELLRTKVFN